MRYYPEAQFNKTARSKAVLAQMHRWPSVPSALPSLWLLQRYHHRTSGLQSGLQRIGVCMAEKNPITQPPSPPAPRPSPISCRYRHGPVPQLLPMISSQIVFSAFVKKKKKYYGEFQIYIKIKEYYTKPPYTHNKPSMSSQPILFHLYLI